VIVFAPRVACKYFPIELAKILHNVAAWADISEITVLVAEIHADENGTRSSIGAHIWVELETVGDRAIDRAELAHYLEAALAGGFLIDVANGRVRVDWFPPPHTPHR
jgi:hypothetical protein